MTQPKDDFLHRTIGFLDVRAQATAAALVQICLELQRVGVFDEGAVTRVKETIAREVALSRPRSPYQAEFDRVLHRLDAIFAGESHFSHATSQEQVPGPQ